MPYNHQNSYNSQKRKRFKVEEVKIKNTMTQEEVKISSSKVRETVHQDNQEVTDDEREVVTQNKKEN